MVPVLCVPLSHWLSSHDLTLNDTQQSIVRSSCHWSHSHSTLRHCASASSHSDWLSLCTLSRAPPASAASSSFFSCRAIHSPQWSGDVRFPVLPLSFALEVLTTIASRASLTALIAGAALIGSMSFSVSGVRRVAVCAAATVWSLLALLSSNGLISVVNSAAPQPASAGCFSATAAASTASISACAAR